MEIAAFCLAGVALVIAMLALLAALDAREFWRQLLEDFKSNERTRDRIEHPALRAWRDRADVT